MTAIEFFAYCYGVLAGPDYTVRFNDEREIPGARIPITSDPNLFEEMSQLGHRLVWLHTYGEPCGLHP